MAVSGNGIAKQYIYWGLIKKIEIRQQGTGSFVNVGRFKNAKIYIEELALEGDPAGSDHVYALEYFVAFDVMQSGSTEIAWLAGTSGTGLYETDLEVKLTFATGRTITLGADADAPLRLVPRFRGGNQDEAQIIPCAGHNIEDIDSFAAKVA